MQASELILKRKSIRSYLNREVEEEKLNRILNTSLRAPSWKNAQGYRILVVQGQRKKVLSEKLVSHALAGNKDNPDFPYQENYPNYIKKRMIELGTKYYGHLGVDRKDMQRRNELVLDNFRFFGAPVVLFFVMDKGMNHWPILDLGILIGTMVVCIREEGLECIAQAALAAYPDIVREELQLSENWKVMVGLSLGYADYNNPQSQFVSQRAEFSEIVSFYY